MSDKSTLLANRLGEILKKLNFGEIISVKDLAQEFNVSERTIQKDLSERLDPTLLEALGNGQYKMLPGFMGNFSSADIKEFSQLSGIIDLYPDINEVLKNKIRDSLIVTPSINKGCIPRAEVFKELNYVINNNKEVLFDYNNKNVVLVPYKLINNNGIWYLLGDYKGQIKSYCLHKMIKVRRGIKKIILNKETLKKIENNPSPWFRHNKKIIKLRSKSSFANYFLDRNIFPEKYNSSINSDGSIDFFISVNSFEEVKGKIKFWLPNIIVLEPIDLDNEIKKEIKKYL